MVGGYPSGFRGIRNDLQLRSVGLVNVALNLGQFQLKPVKEVARRTCCTWPYSCGSRRLADLKAELRKSSLDSPDQSVRIILCS